MPGIKAVMADQAAMVLAAVAAAELLDLLAPEVMLVIPAEMDVLRVRAMAAEAAAQVIAIIKVEAQAAVGLLCTEQLGMALVVLGGTAQLAAAAAAAAQLELLAVYQMELVAHMEGLVAEVVRHNQQHKVE
jgi:hypothetical protein